MQNPLASIAELVAPAPKRVEHVYRPSGAAANLMRSDAREVLMEGPAGTGKTRALLEKAMYLCETFPRTRVLLARQTKLSMADTVLVTLEENCLWPEHPLSKGPSRQSRKNYVFGNGSEMVVAGLRNPNEQPGHRIMSSEFDVVMLFEATECYESDYEKALSRLRKGDRPTQCPYRQIIADCNPGGPRHWLNQRAIAGKMLRLRSKHEDNPTVTEEYLENLRNLSGVRRQRLYIGDWAAPEGMVFECWDPAVHLVEDLPDEVSYTIASKDFGYKDPGVTQIWAVMVQKRAMACVAEIYRTGWSLAQWIEHDTQLRDTFNPRRWVADPSEAGMIEEYRKAGFSIQAANNDLMVGIERCRDRMEDGTMMFKMDRLWFKDEKLANVHQPLSTTAEFENYIYAETRDERNQGEKPRDSYNHGMDAMRYATLYVDRNIVRGAAYIPYSKRRANLASKTHYSMA